MKNEGLYQKYQIRHTDGSPVDPNGQYFVLKLNSSDPAHREACRAALRTYSEKIRHILPQLARDLNVLLYSADTPPKLTAEELARRGIEWPEWANWAAVASYGEACFFETEPPKSIVNFCTEVGEKHCEIPGKWDASNWKTSLIPRPEALPDWCKVGAWVYNKDFGYGTIFNPKNEVGIVVIDWIKSGNRGGALPNQLSEARLRPWTPEEMRQKVGKIFDAEKDSYLATGFIYENIMLATGGEPTLYTAEGLISMQFTVDNSPCGVLERREGEGWVR